MDALEITLRSVCFHLPKFLKNYLDKWWYENLTEEELTEVLADRKTVINGNDDLMIDKQQTINITADRTINIGGTLSETVSDSVQKVYLTTLTTITGDNNLSLIHI